MEGLIEMWEWGKRATPWLSQANLVHLPATVHPAMLNWVRGYSFREVGAAKADLFSFPDQHDLQLIRSCLCPRMVFPRAPASGWGHAEGTACDGA